MSRGVKDGGSVEARIDEARMTGNMIELRAELTELRGTSLSSAQVAMALVVQGELRHFSSDYHRNAHSAKHGEADAQEESMNGAVESKLYLDAIENDNGCWDAYVRLAALALLPAQVHEVVLMMGGWVNFPVHELSQEKRKEALNRLNKLRERSLRLDDAKQLIDQRLDAIKSLPMRWYMFLLGLLMQGILISYGPCDENMADNEDPFAFMWDAGLTTVYTVISRQLQQKKGPRKIELLEVKLGQQPPPLCVDSGVIFLKRIELLFAGLVAYRARHLLRIHRVAECLAMLRAVCADKKIWAGSTKLRCHLCQISGTLLAIRYVPALKYRIPTNAEPQAKGSKTAIHPSTQDEEAVMLLSLSTMLARTINDSELAQGSLSALTWIFCKTEHARALVRVHENMIAADMGNCMFWYNLGVAAFAAEQYAEAFLAAQNALSIKGDFVDALLLGCKLALNHLSNAGEAVLLGRRAIECCQPSSGLFPTCLYVCGTACSKYAYDVWSFAERKALWEEAINHLKGAVAARPTHVPYLFSLALAHADVRETAVSLALVKRLLRLDTGHTRGWQLLSLLYSSEKKYESAVKACKLGAAECSGGKQKLMYICARLYVDKAIMQKQCDEVDSLRSLKLAARAYEELMRHLFTSALPEFVKIGDFYLPDFSDALQKRSNIDDISEAAEYNGELMRDYSSSALKHDSPDALRCTALFGLVDFILFLYAQQVIADEQGVLLRLGSACVQFAKMLSSPSWLPEVYCKFALLANFTNDTMAAVNHYETALSFDANHIESMTRLAALHTKLGNILVARELLTAALRIDSTSHEAWYEMGIVRSAQNDDKQASDAFLTALKLERTVPSAPYYLICRRCQ